MTGKVVLPKRELEHREVGSLDTEYSLNGTPRWRRAWRAWSQPGQSLVVYSVTGYLAIACRVSYGMPAPPPGRRCRRCPAAFLGAVGGLSV